MALTDPLQWVVIAVVAIVFLMWGPKKIPELARSMGMARKEFQAVSQGVQDTTGKLQNPNSFLDSLIAEPRQSTPVQQPRSPIPAASVQKSVAPVATATQSAVPAASVQKSGDQILLDTAQKLGISTDGKTKDEISQEILAKVSPSAMVSA